MNYPAGKGVQHKIERRSISDLIPYTMNARTHAADQIDAISKSITEWGFTIPILIGEDNGIIAGHARLMAAQRLGLPDVPVMVARGWTAAQRRAYVLADNKLALNAGWDSDILKLELGELDLEGFDLALTGFGPDELAGLLGSTEGLTDPDDVPDVQPEAVTQPGDVWVMGRHRLMCGDATRDSDVSLALAGVRPHLMVTDPPYGVSYDGTWRDSAPRRVPGKSKTSYVPNDDQLDWSGAWALFPGDVAYVWCASLHSHSAAESLIAEGFELRASIIWRKHQAIFSRGHYHWQHEPCWYAVRKGSTGQWQGDRKQTTVWDIDTASGYRSGASETVETHGTQKPVECMKRPIENNSSPGQAVYEPFSGSGTTIIAAEMTGRACLAIEISPAYVDVAVRRWQAFTGQQATLESTGRSFTETATHFASIKNDEPQARTDERAA